MVTLPRDQDVRHRALQPRESFHLEAPAGSGKTSVLLARFLTLLAQVQAPEELLALTFTRKAAGELRSRVVQLLGGKNAPDPQAHPWEARLQELAARAFRHFDRKGEAPQEVLAPERLPVMTFHSFCAQLVRLAPQEAGVPWDFQLLEEGEAHWLKQEALEELRRRLGARPREDAVRQALVRRLVRLNNNWPRLARELQDLLARRDTLGEFLELARFSREAGAYHQLLKERFVKVLERVLKGLAEGFAKSDLGRQWPEFWAELRKGGSPLTAELPSQLPGSGWADLRSWQAMAQVLLIKEGEARKALTPQYGFPAGLDRARWGALIKQLPASLLRLLKQCQGLTLSAAKPEEVAALQDLVILLGAALGIYEELCARRRALDFIALERAALNLLDQEDPGDLLLRLDLRLSHLLVDEFQDTSEAQMDLLCRLVAGWEAASGRTLVVVGDPKQSIYGWRQARVRLFKEAREGLPCGPGRPFPLQPLLLTTNFRATRTLIAWTNQVFGDTVMAAATQEGVEFHAADSGPGTPAGEAPHLALFFHDDPQAAREAEARWLARQVAQALDLRKDNGRVGILLFTRTRLPLYLQALKDAGLAVKVREGLKLADSRVVAHLHNLARALIRPQDEVAWAALLRGPWAQQSLKTLAQVARTPGEIWPEKLRHFAGEGHCPPELPRLLESLATARGQVGRRALAEVLRGWLGNTGAWSSIASWEGPGGVANARAYLELLAEAESKVTEATFHKADFLLKEAFQSPDPRAQDSPVEVLTVHGAKGLEFEQVFLPFLDWQALAGEDQAPPFLLEEIPGSGLSALALAPPYVQEKQSSLYVLLRDLKHRRILDEARRVFYVAVTRARQRLVLSGVIKQNSQGRWQAPQESPLGWLWQHYRPEELTPGVPGRWPAPEIQVELHAVVPALRGAPPEPPPLPPTLKFSGEAAPYALEFPSQVVETPKEAAASGPAAEAAATARLRGEVTHGLLETLAQGRELPVAAAVAAALRQGGLTAPQADLLAREIVAEVAACRQDAFLARLLSPDWPEAVSEWLLEDAPAPGVIRRGKIDRLVFDGQVWWLLDYKTSRPQAGEDWESFMAREAEKYRPQLLAYREMAARARGIEPGTIHLLLYFTGCQGTVEL